MSDEHMDGLCKHEIDRFRCIRCLRDENTQLRADLARVEGEQDEASLTRLRLRYAEMVEALRIAAPFVCSMLCPSVKRENEQWTHVASCTAVTSALTAARALQGGEQP